MDFLALLANGAAASGVVVAPAERVTISLFTSQGCLRQLMARVEQKYTVDKEAVEHLIAMLRDGLARGSSDKEIREQTWEILDTQYRVRTDQALKEMKGGRAKRFKNAEQMIKDLSR